MATPNPVPKLYRAVVEDVISSVREAFLDEGVDEQVLQELKQSWESKLLQSKALIQSTPEEQVLASPFALGNFHQSQTVTMKPKVVSNPMTQTISVPIQIGHHTTGTELSGPAQTAAVALSSGLFQQQLAAGLTLRPAGNNHYITVTNIPHQSAQSSPQVASATITIPNANTLVHNPVHTTASVDTTQVTHKTVNASAPSGIIQLDGHEDTSSEDEDEYDNDENEDAEDDVVNEEELESGGIEEEPLNSGDDVSEEDVSELFDTDNVVVCQYEKIHRNKNKWKFQLKDGIMNLNGKDAVFHKGVGDAEW